MDREVLAPALGIATCVAVLVLAAVPYGLAGPTAVRVYYDAGIAGPPLVSLFAVIVVIVFLAGLRGRSDPALVAGVGLVLGAFMAVLSVSWAASVSPSIVGGFTDVASFRYHRWLLAVAAVIVPIAAGWYARVVLYF